MRILYLNPSFTCYRLYATLPGRSWQEYPPPYDEIVEHIAPDVVFRETRGSNWKFSCNPIGADYREMISGNEIAELGRPLGPGDELTFLSLAHLFRTLYEDVLNTVVDLRKSGATVRFWKEGLRWDFENDRSGVHAQIGMLQAMNGYVYYKEEMAVKRHEHYQAAHKNQAKAGRPPETP